MISDDFNCRLNGTVEPEDLLVSLFHTRLPQPLYGELCLYRFLMFIHLMNFIIPHQGFKTGNVILSTLFGQEMIQIFSKCRDMTVCQVLESKLFIDESACKLLEMVDRHLGGLLVLQQLINKKEIPVLFLECYFQEIGFHAFDSYIGLDTVAIRYDSSISGFELPSSGVLLCNRQGVILCVVQSLNPPAAWNKIFCNGQLQRGVV